MKYKSDLVKGREYRLYDPDKEPAMHLNLVLAFKLQGEENRRTEKEILTEGRADGQTGHNMAPANGSLIFK